MYELVHILQDRVIGSGMMPSANEPGRVKAVCGYGHFGDGALSACILISR